MGAFSGPGGRELLDALTLSAYLVGATFAAMALVMYHMYLKRRQAETRLRLAAAAFESSIQGMILTDGSGAIEQVNPAFEQLTGYGRHEAAGRALGFIADPADAGLFPLALEAVQGQGYWEGDLRAARKDGTGLLLHATFSGVRRGDGGLRSYAVSLVDISAHKRAEQRIRHLAHHDLLTDLPNRALLHEKIDAAITRARRDGRKVALMFVDLDRFKNVNDSLGHAAGDELLRRYAMRLTEALRAADVVARQGGDEFAVLAADLVGAQDAARVAGKLLEAAQRPFEIGERTLQVGCSVGIALYPDSGEDFETLLRNADTAMYAAKEDGRGCYRFHSAEMSRRATERMELEHGLRQALADGAGLSLALQPQIDMLDGTLVGMEALARWKHPQRGAVSPAQFVPIAEDSGLILALGEWALREACRLRARWLAAGLERGAIAVNVSSMQFREPDFLDTVKRVLQEAQLPAALLELEVTESVLMAGVEQVSATLEALGRLGLQLAIDDFGTGYSSLGYLKRLPVHKLKIDRSFVIELPRDPNSCAIAEAIVGMANGLNLRVIAEGVETEPQAEFLRRCGCHEAQGYLYAAPLGAQGFEARYLS
ncbi:MAG TPA: EAL domain-containing protein [Burkholderiales bacterium]|nr:EAL domain-containing protein [Burkholderiales bacterium]